MPQLKNMVQYGVWPNCCNNCAFCLREERRPYSKNEQLKWLDIIKKNICIIDWQDKFDCGISLLGGELYYITDINLQESFLELIDIIIEKVLKVSKNPNCKYSTVTNGLYNLTFLYKVVDKIVNAVGINKIDINFSYDMKYRFKDEKSRLLCLKNINDFHKRYDYSVGVQMILTQYVIDLWKKNEFSVTDFEKTYIPGNILTFLYPHPINTGLKLPDFNFKRNDFFKFLNYLRNNNYSTYLSFMLSTQNSCIFKYTGLRDRKIDTYDVQPQLSDGKEIINPSCKHSVLYQCYSDSDKCMLCDLKQFDTEIFK